MHLQKTTSRTETIEAKNAFEMYARSHGMTVEHYHANNGRFAENKFHKAVAQKGQTLSFCGINAHWQNGVAERRIRELQDHARTMLIHANRCWPKAIDTHLWPYAVRTANDVFNSTPDIKQGFTPIKAFSGTNIAPNPKHFYPFGCPVYALDNSMQAGKKISKWSERTWDLSRTFAPTCQNGGIGTQSYNGIGITAISHPYGSKLSNDEAFL